VYVGRLSPRKGPDLVVSALHELVERGLDVTLTMVGDVFPGYEWFEVELRQAIASADLTERVDFVGFQASVWRYLQDADIAVIPSRLDESFGNTLVEAVLAGRPAVASDHTGLAEIGRDLQAVELVANDDASAIVDAVQRIVGDWDRYRSDVLEDARRLEERIGPDRYHASVLGALESLART
jgi:glycosyltransferase involved in cell wall biosynthesis